MIKSRVCAIGCEKKKRRNSEGGGGEPARGRRQITKGVI